MPVVGVYIYTDIRCLRDKQITYLTYFYQKFANFQALIFKSKWGDTVSRTYMGESKTNFFNCECHVPSISSPIVVCFFNCCDHALNNLPVMAVLILSSMTVYPRKTWGLTSYYSKVFQHI